MKRYFIIMGMVFVFICGIIAGCAVQTVNTITTNEPVEKQVVAAYLDHYRSDVVYDEIVIGDIDILEDGHGELTEYAAFYEGKLVCGGWINVPYYSYLLG